MAALTTDSGLRIEAQPVDVAQAFLERYGLPGYRPGDDDLAWGASEGSGPPYGIAVLASIRPPRAHAWIAVGPERRRLGVGLELAAALLRNAQDLDLQYLTGRHRTGEIAPDRLTRSLGVPFGRRVDRHTVWTVIVVPRLGQGERR